MGLFSLNLKVHFRKAHTVLLPNDANKQRDSLKGLISPCAETENYRNEVRVSGMRLLQGNVLPISFNNMQPL